METDGRSIVLFHCVFGTRSLSLRKQLNLFSVCVVRFFTGFYLMSMLRNFSGLEKINVKRVK